jgi:hypothetical protein
MFFHSPLLAVCGSGAGKNEITFAQVHIYTKHLAVDEDGRVLIWTDTSTSAHPPAVLPTPERERAPLAYTPPHLTDQILASRAALEGERKHVTVLFADIQGSTELLQASTWKTPGNC